MSRVVRLVIIIGLVVALVVGGVILARTFFGGGGAGEEAAVDEAADQLEGLRPAEVADRSGQSSLEADDDNDGLSNADELTWQTDPLNPDTDGDGFLDGEEVAARHDPRKPAPDDRLDAAPTANLVRKDGRPAASPLQTDKYLSDNVDLIVSKDNLTEVFEKKYKDADRSRATLDDFAGTYPVAQLLPKPAASEISDPLPTSDNLLGQYLAMADNQHALANSTLYISSHSHLRNQNDPAGFLGMADILRSYRSDLQVVQVPDEAVEIHRLLLGYSAFLIATFDQTKDWTDDPVKVLVALRQAEGADKKYYPLIRGEFSRLQLVREQLYR